MWGGVYKYSPKDVFKYICKEKLVVYDSAAIEFSQVIFPEEKDEVKKCATCNYRDQETREIEGYLAPFYMFKNESGYLINKNDLYIKVDGNYKPEKYSINIIIPAEWVEKEWEPKYKEEVIMVGKYPIDADHITTDIKKKKNVWINNICFNEDFWEAARLVAEKTRQNIYLYVDESGNNPFLALETIEKIIDKIND